MTVFDFSDYREFLRKYIQNLPKKGRGELNRLSQYIDVHPSLLSQVLNNDKNLSLEQAQMITEYLGFSSQETEYFLLSAQLQRAGSAKLRSYFHEKLLRLKEASIEVSQRVRQDRTLSEIEKSIFYSHWLYASVWLQTSMKAGQTVDEIASLHRISREQALEILKFLSETQLCVLENGLYKMGPQSIHLERNSVYLHKHHTNWRLRAIEASDKISNEEIMYTAPISISKSDREKIRKRLLELIREVTDTAIQSEAEEALCFNLDFFFVSR